MAYTTLSVILQWVSKNQFLTCTDSESNMYEEVSLLSLLLWEQAAAVSPQVSRCYCRQHALQLSLLKRACAAAVSAPVIMRYNCLSASEHVPLPSLHQSACATIVSPQVSMCHCCLCTGKHAPLCGFSASNHVPLPIILLSFSIILLFAFYNNSKAAIWDALATGKRNHILSLHQ